MNYNNIKIFFFSFFIAMFLVASGQVFANSFGVDSTYPGVKKREFERAGKAYSHSAIGKTFSVVRNRKFWKAAEAKQRRQNRNCRITNSCDWWIVRQKQEREKKLAFLKKKQEIQKKYQQKFYENYLLVMNAGKKSAIYKKRKKQKNKPTMLAAK